MLASYKMVKITENDLNNIQVNISKYCLINIKAFFIISYMYISVVNLISTTATSEATIDEQGESRFDITSLPHHRQQNVSRIDDPILWNCRETSLTKDYYVVLYSMLLGVSGLATLIFFGVKTLNFCGDNPLRRLWEVAVAQHLKETLSAADFRCPNQEDADEITKCYQNIFYVNKDLSEIKKSITSSYMRLRIFAPILSTLCLVVGWWLLLLSYDLHPVSCLSGPNEDTIDYTESESAVKIKYSPHWLRFQVAAVIIGAILLTAVVLNSVFFYAINGLIVGEMKEMVNEMYNQVASRRLEPETTVIN